MRLMRIVQPFLYGLSNPLIAFCQISFSGAELEVEVDADGEVALVVGDEETEELLVLAFLFIIKKGEDEAMIGALVVGFPVFLATIDKGLFLHLLARRHREMDALPHLVVGGVEGTGEGENGKHVVVAIIGFMVMLGKLAVTIEEFLLHVTLAVGIGVPHLIDGVVLTLEGTLAEVEGNELGRDVGDEGVAHGEDGITPLVGGEKQVVAQGRLALVVGSLHRIVGGTTLHPDELPLEVKVVSEALPCLECRVLRGTLGKGRDGKEEKTDDNELHSSSKVESLTISMMLSAMPSCCGCCTKGLLSLLNAR